MAPEDEKWPRAATWLGGSSSAPRFAVLGVPAHRTSISETSAHETPQAVRQALLKYSTYSSRLDQDLFDLPVRDFGDVVEPDFAEGESRVAAAVSQVSDGTLLFAIGGDNSITYLSLIHI